MGIETVSLIIAAFVDGSVGIAAFMRNSRSRLCVSFAVLAGFLFVHDALSVLESFDSGGGFSNPKTHVMITLLVGLVMVWLLREVVPAFRNRLNKVMTGYVLVALLCLVLLNLGIYDRIDRALFAAVHLSFLIPAAVWVGVFFRAQERTTLTREKLRLRYAFWGAVITIGFFITNAMSFAGFALPPLGTLARTLYLIFIFQTFIQKELMTAEEVVAKIALFGAISLTLSLIYSLLVSWVGDQRDLFFFNTFLASFGIIVLFDPIRKATTRWTRRLFLQRNSLLEDELGALSAEILGLVEPADLARRLRTTLRAVLGVGDCVLYLLDRDGLSYARVDSAPAVPQGPGFVAEVSSSNVLVEYMALRKGRPFVLETIESDRDSFHSAQPRKFCQSCLDTMRSLGADFIIPFSQETRPIGFCAVKTGERLALSNEQLRLFIPLARQIALLLKNAETFTFLRDQAKLAALGEMAAGLAHEIKNPLGAIKGAAELLKETERGEGADARSREFIQIIVDESNRLSGVLSEFLDYAKPRRTYSQTSCDPMRVIEHTAALCVRERKVKLEVSTEHPGLTLDADPEILKQVLLNLFLNALEAMEGVVENPSLRIHLRELRTHRLFAFADTLPLFKVWEGWEASPHSQVGPIVEIEVRDNGPGIAPEDLPRIFTPFFTTKAKGTGLGLAICQRLVEGMGGTIQVKSNRPTGTVFTVHIPVRREPAAIPGIAGSTRSRTSEPEKENL